MVAEANNKSEMKLKYGDSSIELRDDLVDCIIEPNSLPGVDTIEEIERALDHPLRTEKLEDLVSGGDTIALIVSDVTRPCRRRRWFPPY